MVPLPDHSNMSEILIIISFSFLGEISMKKVKVQRYISGKRPEYAQAHSSDEEEEEDDFIDNRKHGRHGRHDDETGHSQHDDYEASSSSRRNHDNDEYDDPRLRRLTSHRHEEDYGRRLERHREIHQPEIVSESSSDSSSSDEEVDVQPQRETADQQNYTMQTRKIALASDSESDGELSETEIEKRRQTLRQKMMQQQKEEELLAKEDEKQSESSDSESSEYEEETESEEENEPRLKPLFVRKRDRTTVIEKEKETIKQKQVEHEAKKMAKERRRQTLRLVEDSVKQDLDKVKVESSEPNINDVCTDDENDEVEYEAWKLRELRRIKRDREEKEGLEKDKIEIDRLRNMTEEERRQELRLNPKQVTNKASKGKYKFLQKYFHRGAFYLDEEQEVFKRDFAQATLEDHFDKTILPKVMQVKNFGRCGRTKYTHLVDQDTTQFDSPWYSDTANNIKFHNEKAGGMKQVFDKPSLVKRKKF